MTNYARVEKKIAKLSTDFGYKVAVEKFGQALVDAMPTYSRGPRKGKPKGALCWTKCERGGWVGKGSDGCQPLGHVARPGSSDWRLTLSPDSQHDQGLVARWHWQIQDGRTGGFVEVVQEPGCAAEAYKAYGDNVRYG